MLDLVLPLFHPTVGGVQAAKAAWQYAFEDWAPTTSIAADGDPMPLVGLQELKSALTRTASLYGAEAVHGIADQLALISAACNQYAAAGSGSHVAARAAWVDQIAQRRTRLLELVGHRIDEASEVLEQHGQQV